MDKFLSYFKKNSHLLILGIILLIGLIFRTYKVIDRFEFAHDGDLFSWIAKDIIVDHHLRLIGQLTTAPGIFIGPLYYYLNIPFLLLTKMDPIGAIIPITIIGVLTIFSYYVVFSKLFNIKLGLIAAFLYAVLLSLAQLDRRVVPSTPTNLWTIWYFFTIVHITKGRYKYLPILGILIGLIWHIHIALLPALIAIPAAFICSKKLPTKKQIIFFLITLLITSLPLIIFEARHNFQQTISLFHNFSSKGSDVTGLYKFQLVIEMVINNINTLFFMPQSYPQIRILFFITLTLLPILIFFKRKLLSLKELIPLYFWIFGVIAFYSFTSSPISGYYFANIEVIYLLFASSLFFFLYSHSNIGKTITFIIFSIVLIKNSTFLVSQDYYHKGYLEKKKLVEYVVKDAKSRNFPCVGISYITTPGENVGFRYLFYLQNIHLVHPSLDVPVYNIVIPDELSLKEVKMKFGHIGLIPPKDSSYPKLHTICQGENTNLTDSMFGFVN